MAGTIYPPISPGGNGQPSGTPPPNNNTTILGLPSNKEFFLWAISAIALIALADPAPNMAVFLAWILIVSVVLMNSTVYIGLLNSAFGGSNANA